MSRPFKVDIRLSEMTEEDRAAYDKLLRDPASTVDDRVEFFLSRDKSISRGAVWKHGKSFQDMLDRVRERSEFAAAFGTVAREGGAEEIAAGTILKLQQQFFDVAMNMDDGTELTPKDWSDISKAAKNLVGANTDNRRLQRELADEKAKAKAAIEAASKAASNGSSGAAVVDAIKLAMGITGGAA